MNEPKKSDTPVRVQPVGSAVVMRAASMLEYHAAKIRKTIGAENRRDPWSDGRTVAATLELVAESLRDACKVEPNAGTERRGAAAADVEMQTGAESAAPRSLQ